MSEERIEKAVQIFSSGFNCAQAVFAAFADGLPEQEALKLATGFGGGIGRQGEICGAVSGAVMAISHKHGRASLEETGARDETYRLVGEFLREFRSRYASMDCRDLLGVDMSQPGQHEVAAARGLFREVCPAIVKTAAEILADMGI